MELSLHTDLSDLTNVKRDLEAHFSIKYPAAYTREKCMQSALEADVIFTNPNDLGFRYDSDFISRCKKLKVLATASTGTDHIDLDCLKNGDIHLICLRDDAEFMSSVTATAEHAVCLTLMGLRRIPKALSNIRNGDWTWKNCIGRQVSSLTVGVIGMGRLGKIYSRIMAAMGAKVYGYDPHVGSTVFQHAKPSSLATVLNCDVISLHIHATPENYKLVAGELLDQMPPSGLLVNTSRGGIVDEYSLANHLRTHPRFSYATDVLSDELTGHTKSPLMAQALGDQVIVTPHIGGMTFESRELAYGRAVTHLVSYVLGQ